MKRILPATFMLLSACIAFGDPTPVPNASNVIPQPVFKQSNFRAVIVGDSQTTSSNSARVTAHYHQWDGPFVGEFLGTSSSASGNSINCVGTSQMSYRNIDPDNGWSDGGAGDFFCVNGREWTVSQDVSYNGALIGRFRINLSPSNTDAPWSYNWVENKDLVFRVAIRSGPNSVPAIEIRPDRGNIGSGTVFEIDSTPGIQIFEIAIPASMNPTSTLLGGAILFPDNYIEEDGQLLQVLGAYIGLPGDPDGLVIGYQGDGGWNLLKHQTILSQDSRVALVEMMHLNTMIMFMGHNREVDNQQIFPVRAVEVMGLWDTAFDTAGASRPKWVLVEPWRIQEGNWDEYGDIVENGLSMIAQLNRRSTHVRYGDLFNELRPDEFDPIRYQLDTALVHPGNTPTARFLSEDLEFLIFGN